MVHVPRPYGNMISGQSNPPVHNMFNLNPFVENPQWWDYLGYDDEEQYNRRLTILNQLKAQNENSLNIFYLDDESSEFFGYSYEEILEMSDNGTVIPEEILNWAQSMAQNNPTTKSEPIQTDDAEALYISLKNNPDMNIKSSADIFTKKCEENRLILTEYNETLVTLNKDVSVLKNEIEAIVEKTKKELEPLKDEWDDISYKLSNGIPLTEDENIRAQFLKDKFGEIDEDCKSQIYSKIININYYLDMIAEVTLKIEVANSFSRVSKTILDDLNDPQASGSGKSVISSNNYSVQDELSNEDLSTDYTTALFNVVYKLDAEVTEVDFKSGSMQEILNEMAQIGGFKLDDPNHSINLSFIDDIDFSLLNNEGDNVVEEDETDEEETEEESDLSEDFENLTVEVPLETEPDPIFGYNPEAIKVFKDFSFDNSSSEKPYIKPVAGTFNQGNSNKKR